MKVDLREIYGAPTRAAAEAAIDVFADKYNAKHDKAVACLTKDREALLAFFDFPAEHWDHLRMSNPIESVFATVRHRTVRTKGSPVGEDCQAYGVQTRQRRRKNMATIERRNQFRKSSKASNSKTASRSSKCRHTTPPDRSRHPISRIALVRMRWDQFDGKGIQVRQVKTKTPLWIACHSKSADRFRAHRTPLGLHPHNPIRQGL